MMRLCGRLGIFTVGLIVRFLAAETISPPPSTSPADAGEAGSERGVFIINGTVVQMVPDYSEERFVQLERAGSKSWEAFRDTLEDMHKSRPAPNAVVVLKGPSGTSKTNADAQGRFRFAGLPLQGVYELSAEMPLPASQPAEKRLATTKTRFEGHGVRNVQLVLRPDLVTITGKITDTRARPVAGAKVIAEPSPYPEVGTPVSGSTVSRADGSYEMQGLVPHPLRAIAGYLNGGDPTEGGQWAFFVEIRVEADGFVQTQVPKVALITEELLVPARRYLKMMHRLREAHGHKSVGARKEPPLPASHGNTITGIDIMLDKARTGGK